MLSDSDSDANDLHTLTINQHFAKAFEYKKEREELAKLKEKYGSDYSDSGADDDDDDSEDTEEDTDGEELTPAVDAAILRTLALIKKKDPAIYEGGRQVFEEEHTRIGDKAPVVKSKTKEKSKPLTIREAALASALAEADSHSRSQSPELRPLTHTEEQALLRAETRAAFHGVVDAEPQGNDDDLLIPRSRTRDEIELEEEEYKAFLEREVGEDIRDLIIVDSNEAVGTTSNDETAEGGDREHEGKKKKGKREREREKEREKYKERGAVQDKKAQKQRGKRSKEEEDREFLMSYIFNRGWVDHSNRRIPTYSEVVESSSKQLKRRPTDSPVNSDSNDGIDKHSHAEQNATLSDDNSFDDLADAFETSYNFRFEEPGGALIASFPRNLTSARREATTRKDARTRKKERLQAEKQALLGARREEIRRERALVEAAVSEKDGSAFPIEEDTTNKKKSRKQQRREELARLKTLKANELRRKLERVSSEGGLDGIGAEALAHLGLDADWDPSKHDAQMAELYCGDEDIVDGGDAKKPVWDDDINIDDIVPPANTKSKAELKRQRKREKKKNEYVNEDAGVDVDEMDADAGRGSRDDDDEGRGTEEERKHKVDAYMDEVVNRLGFSGITSHMPTRFHYTTTTPENYGLTAAEILLATDAELNSYIGLKKLAPYRVDKGGKGKKHWDPKRTERLKEFRENLQSRVGSRYEGSWSLAANINSSHGAADKQEEKKKRKGKKERAKLRAMQGDEDGEGDIGSHPGEAEMDGDDAAQTTRKRRRRHKKGSSRDAREADAIAIS